LRCLLLFSLLLAASNSSAFNAAYPDLSYWEQWAISNGYNIDDYVYSEGNSTGIDGEIGNEFVCIRDDANQVIIGRPDVCGTYYNGLGYDFADITTDPTNLTGAPDIIDAVTENLVDPNLANWGGCNYTGVNRGGTNPGGPRPNCGQDIINWSYGGYWVYRRHAIEQALKQAGVNVDGYQWEFIIKNNNADRADQAGVDTLDIRMYIWDNSGNMVHNKSWRYDTKFDWTTFSGTELFANPLVGENLRDWQLQMYGRDTGYWSGFYGPEIKTPEIRMIYSSNPCAIDPLLHPDCDGYVQAYTDYVYDQNCTANPLYDTGCPGYQQAFFTQQCNANALYDPSCPGYAGAYYDQQCSFNPLYDSGCPGYQQAYFDQQCSLDPFYDTSCPGYAQAYYDQQCSIDALHDSGCPGYAEAYYDQQCSISALYDSGCPGYAQAFYDQQCGLNALYDSGCPGYEQAYYDQQCSINALYDTGCPGYAQAYYDNQCGLDPLYDTGCNGYADAFFSQQCGLDALYDSQCPGYATAYYNQQCGLDALYDSGCPGYEQAYFVKFIQPELERQAQEASGNNEETSTTPVATANATSTEDPVAALTATPATGDATVDQVLRETANVSTTIELPGMVETTPTAGPNIQADTSSGSSSETEAAPEAASAEQELEAELASLDEGASSEEEVSESGDNVDESSDEGESDSGDAESGDGDSGEDSKDEGDGKSDSKEKKSPEESKRDKLKKIATQRAMMLAETMGAAASLEQQQAIQAQIAALINFVPGFNAYGQVGIPGGDMYANQPFYEDKKVPENQRGLRNGLAQQLLHEKMVEQQYENMK